MSTGLRKKLAILALAATVAATAAGCGKGGTKTEATSANGPIELQMWTHNAGNKGELGAITTIVNDYNASQTKYKVNIQAFPQDSYNQSVVAAAASKKLPCILDIDGPNVPNWAWAGYLAPITGMDDILAKYLPSTVATWNGKTYAYGYYDVALTMLTRKSLLAKYGIRVPTMDQPWTGDEFTAALKKVKASGDFEYPADFATSFTGEWWPYAYSPMLQSFGGDLVNRDGFTTADGSLNGAAALAWGTWFQGLAKDGLISKKSGSDPAKDFINGKSMFLWNGSWTAVDARKALGDDVLFAPPPDFGKGPKIGGASWQWGISGSCSNAEGALDYMKFASADKYVAKVAQDTNNIPTTDAAAAMVPGYEAGGTNDAFRQYAKKYAVMRPETPGYPFIATEFTKVAQDILNGADVKAALDQAVKNIDANQKANNYFK